MRSLCSGTESLNGSVGTQRNQIETSTVNLTTRSPVLRFRYPNPNRMSCTTEQWSSGFPQVSHLKMVCCGRPRRRVHPPDVHLPCHADTNHTGVNGRARPYTPHRAACGDRYRTPVSLQLPIRDREINRIPSSRPIEHYLADQRHPNYQIN